MHPYLMEYKWRKMMLRPSALRSGAVGVLAIISDWNSDASLPCFTAVGGASVQAQKDIGVNKGPGPWRRPYRLMTHIPSLWRCR